MWKSVSLIDEEKKKKKLLELKEGTLEIHQEEKTALQEKLKLIEKAKNEVDMLLSRNNIAMSKVDTAAAELGQSRTQEAEAETEVEKVMEEIAKLTRSVVDFYKTQQ